MKYIGIAILFSAFSFLGFSEAKKCILAIESIKRAEFLLKNIVFCLKKERMTVNKIFENCICECDEKTKAFLESFSFRNSQNIDFIAQKSEFCLLPEVNSVLQEAFSVLGKYSAEHQISEIEFCRKKIGNIYEKREKDFLSKAKLFRYSGILSGLFFAVMLI